MCCGLSHLTYAPQPQIIDCTDPTLHMQNTNEKCWYLLLLEDDGSANRCRSRSYGAQGVFLAIASTDSRPPRAFKYKQESEKLMLNRHRTRIKYSGNTMGKTTHRSLIEPCRSPYTTLHPASIPLPSSAKAAANASATYFYIRKTATEWWWRGKWKQGPQPERALHEGQNCRSAIITESAKPCPLGSESNAFRQ